jgi:hypothetical protein
MLSFIQFANKNITLALNEQIYHQVIDQMSLQPRLYDKFWLRPQTEVYPKKPKSNQGSYAISRVMLIDSYSVESSHHCQTPSPTLLKVACPLVEECQCRGPQTPIVRAASTLAAH